MTRVSLNDQSWREFKKIFTPPSRSAEQERDRIKKAISLFEHKVGALTHTNVDVGDTFKKIGKGQLDCVDESTNTTIYMALLQQKGWIVFHDIEPPQVRTPFTTGAWPHQTASIRDKKTGARFAVDSWFDDNGLPPYIVPLDDWIMGWKPADWDQR